MMELFNVSPLKFQDFLLVMVRVSSFMVTAPFFAFRFIPTFLKILFSTIISFLIVSCLPAYNHQIATNIEFVAVIFDQVIVGLLLGIVSNLVFEAVRFGGEIIDLQMGFGMANIIDPTLQMRQTLFGEFNYMIAVIIFLVINGHHVLLLNLIKTFEKVPLYNFSFPDHFELKFIASYTDIFILGLKMALPILAVLLIIDVISGLISRLIPQLNIFVLSLPFKISGGFLCMIMFFPQLISFYKGIIHGMFINIKNLF